MKRKAVLIWEIYEKTSDPRALNGVNSFPTYKLIDRDGNILDVNADPRELDALANLLKTICADNK